MITPLPERIPKTIKPKPIDRIIYRICFAYFLVNPVNPVHSCFFWNSHQGLPQVHHGVRPPGPPRLARGEHATRVGLAESLPDSEIRMRKRIRPGQGPHRDVLRGPFADARQLTQPPERRLDV